MASLSKKISKLKKNAKNCLVLGSLFGALEQVDNNFNSIFLVSNTNFLKKKNIIYRENLDSISFLPDIDFIFIDKEYFPVIKEIIQVWRKFKPFIVTEGNDPPEKDIIKFLRSENYQISYADKSFCVWTFVSN